MFPLKHAIHPRPKGQGILAWLRKYDPVKKCHPGSSLGILLRRSTNRYFAGPAGPFFSEWQSQGVADWPSLNDECYGGEMVGLADNLIESIHISYSCIIDFKKQIPCPEAVLGRIGVRPHILDEHALLQTVLLWGAFIHLIKFNSHAPIEQLSGIIKGERRRLN